MLKENAKSLTVRFLLLFLPLPLTLFLYGILYWIPSQQISIEPGLLLVTVLLLSIFQGLAIVMAIRSASDTRSGAILNRLASRSAVGEMSSATMHELNQPLCVIRGYLELLSLSAKDKDPKTAAALSTSLECVERIGRIMNSSRIFANYDSWKTECVSLPELFETAHDFLRAQLKQHGVELTIKCEENLPKVNTDPHYFQLLFVNLLANARDSLDARGDIEPEEFHKKIMLSFRHDKERNLVVFEMLDNGLGMSGKVLKNCTRLFYTTKPGGTGLGLPVVQGIVEASSGRLQIRSGEKEGCWIVIELPPAANAP